MQQTIKKEFNWFPVVALFLVGFVAYSFISGGIFLGLFSFVLVGGALLF